jgi:hypothetical protein
MDGFKINSSSPGSRVLVIKAEGEASPEEVIKYYLKLVDKLASSPDSRLQESRQYFTPVGRSLELSFQGQEKLQINTYRGERKTILELTYSKP